MGERKTEISGAGRLWVKPRKERAVIDEAYFHNLLVAGIKNLFAGGKRFGSTFALWHVRGQELFSSPCGKYRTRAGEGEGRGKIQVSISRASWRRGKEITKVENIVLHNISPNVIGATTTF